MQSDYIDERNGGYYVAGTRISLDSVVYAFNQGNSPERILERYPLLEKLSRIYGAIAFYLDHQSEVDSYLKASQRQSEEGISLSESNPPLWNRLQQAKSQLTESGPAEPRS